MTDDCTTRFITPADPEFFEARRLRHGVLYEPLGIAERDVNWDDAAQGALHLVVFRRGDMVGYGRLNLRDDTAQVRYLAVARHARGTGIGRVLLDTLVNEAVARGARLVFLYARFPSQGLYRNRGFETVGQIVYSDNTHLPHQRMELVLA